MCQLESGVINIKFGSRYLLDARIIRQVDRRLALPRTALIDAARFKLKIRPIGGAKVRIEALAAIGVVTHLEIMDVMVVLR